MNAQPVQIAGSHRQQRQAVGAVGASRGHALNANSDTAIRRKDGLKGKRAAIVLYSDYATDPRPRREAEALARAGMEIDVICLQAGQNASSTEIINGINVYRVPLKRRRLGKLVYAAQYSWFIASAFFRLSAWHLRRPYQLVHVHNMPDALVFSAAIPKCFGAKIVLDLHDPMPELTQSIYQVPEEHLLVRVLKKFERGSIAFADLVITPNLAFQELFASRSCPPEKIAIVVNSPDEKIFNPATHPPLNGSHSKLKTFTLMYHGLLVERHGLDIAIQAVAALRARIPGLRLQIYGAPTDYSRKMEELVQELKLNDIVQFHGFKPLDDIANSISQIDLGLIPNRLNPFTQINLPTRIFEYLAMNKPVLAPITRGIRDYFNSDELLFWDPGSVEDLAAKIEWAYRNPIELQQQLRQGRAVYEHHSWEAEERHFINLVANLIDRDLPLRQPGQISATSFNSNLH